MPRGLPYLPLTDGIRALACVTIIVWHAVLTVIPENPTSGQELFILPLGVIARESVTAFIVLSGLLLGRHWDLKRSTEKFLDASRIYAGRRLWRLAPPYWVALTIAIACMLVFGLRNPSGTHWDTGLPLTWERVLTNYTLVTDLAFEVPLSHQLWTIPVELHLYLLGPLVVLVMGRRNLALALGFLISVAIVLFAPHYHAPYFPFLFIFSFWAGLRRQQHGTQTLGETLRLCRAGFALSGLLIVVAFAAGTLPESTFNYFVADAVAAPLFCLWLFHADFAGSRNFLVPIMEWRVLQWVGQRSFSIYLIHAVVIELLWRGIFDPLGADDAPLDIVLLTVASIIASIGAGVLLYELVERPSARKSAAFGRTPATPSRAKPVDGGTPA